MAKTPENPVISLSQLSAMLRSDQTSARVRDLRDSGSIEQDADSIIMLTVKRCMMSIPQRSTICRTYRHKTGLITWYRVSTIH